MLSRRLAFVQLRAPSGQQCRMVFGHSLGSTSRFCRAGTPRLERKKAGRLRGVGNTEEKNPTNCTTTMRMAKDPTEQVAVPVAANRMSEHDLVEAYVALFLFEVYLRPSEALALVAMGGMLELWSLMIHMEELQVRGET